jgi:hypothetical protein
MEFLIVQFSPSFCHFTPLGPNILLSTLFSNTLNPSSSSNPAFSIYIRPLEEETNFQVHINYQ